MVERRVHRLAARRARVCMGPGDAAPATTLAPAASRLTHQTRPAANGAQGRAAHKLAPQQYRDELLRLSELIISNVLRAGVLLSAGVITLGVVLFYVGWLGAGRRVATSTFPHSLAVVGQGLVHGNPLAIIALGLLLLLATPVLRVSVSVITFAIERDRLYLGITLVVLAILALSFLLGKAGG